MWRPWTKIRWTIRLSTLILLTLVAGLSFALYVQHRREARLVSELRFARHFNEETIKSALDKPFKMQIPLGGSTTLFGLLSYIRIESRTGYLWDGAPIIVDPRALVETGFHAPIPVPPSGAAIKTVLREELGRRKLYLMVEDGILIVTSQEELDRTKSLKFPLD
jgi:hypothetical protein